MKTIHIRTKESTVHYRRKTINAAIRMQSTFCGLSCTDRDIGYEQGRKLTPKEIQWFKDHNFKVCDECIECALIGT